MRLFRKIISSVFALCLVACAQQKEYVWTPDQAWWESASKANPKLNDANGKSYDLNKDAVVHYDQVAKKLMILSGVKARLGISDKNELNAFAYMVNGEGHISITLPLLRKLGDDPSTLAAIVGHELAHLKLQHAEIREARNGAAEGLARIAGFALGFGGIPFGGVIADTGKTIIVTSYSRDEERAADALGLEWAYQAGYSPCGFSKFFLAVQPAQPSGSLNFLETHPGGEERLHFINQFAQGKGLSQCN